MISKFALGLGLAAVVAEGKLAKMPGVGCNKAVLVGTYGSFDSPESCMAEALKKDECGSAVMFSEGYNESWGCRCCTAENDGFGGNSNWDTYFDVLEGRCVRPEGWCSTSWATYEYKDCDGDGIPDHVCSDPAGWAIRGVWVIVSGSGCEGTDGTGGSYRSCAATRRLDMDSVVPTNGTRRISGGEPSLLKRLDVESLD